MKKSSYLDDPRVFVETIGSPAAEAFWKQTPRATPFTRPVILEALCAQVDWWQASFDGVPVCLWPVCHRADGKIDSPELSYYVGPFFSEAVDKGSVRTRVFARAKALAALSDALIKAYGGFSIELVPGEDDVRPFLWWARERGLEHALGVRPQYTGQLDLSGLQDDARLMDCFGKLDRKRPVIRMMKWLDEQQASWNESDVDRLYLEMAVRQGQPDIHARRGEELQSLCALVRAGHGFVDVLSTPGAQSISTLRLILLEAGLAYNVLALADESARDANLVPLATFSAIRRSRRDGARIFDFNGANSLVRGYDVHSYGAAQVLYFSVECVASCSWGPATMAYGADPSPTTQLTT